MVLGGLIGDLIVRFDDEMVAQPPRNAEQTGIDGAFAKRSEMFVPTDRVQIPPHRNRILNVESPLVVDTVLRRARVRELGEQVVPCEREIDVGTCDRLETGDLSALRARGADPGGEICRADLVGGGDAAAEEREPRLVRFAERELVLGGRVHRRVDAPTAYRR